MRVGVFGGAFDPIHHGHLLLAEQSREQLALDEVLFVPVGQPVHRDGASLAPAEHRAAMVELAIRDHPAFSLWRIELDRDAPSFTVETLEILHRERPADERFLLIASSWLSAFDTWRAPERILELARLAVANRGGAGDTSRPAGLDLLAHRLNFVAMPALEISASDLRARLRSGRSVRYVTPPEVIAYINAHGLYGA